ncbi:MAG: 3-isopropylmalate dehydratase large subunit [Bacillota bacterium]
MRRPMTITEKILAAHAGVEEVAPGSLVEVKVDFLMANDITAPLAIAAFAEMGAKRVFDPGRVAIVLSHFAPSKDIRSADQCRVAREFAREQGLTHYYEMGEGIEHALLPDRGLVLPGEVVLGADSHTCTYGAVGCFATGVGSTDLAYAMATGETWLKVPETMKFVYYGRVQPWVSGKDLILYTIGRISCDGATYKAMEFTGEALASLGMDTRLAMANMAIEAGGKNGIFNPDERMLRYVAERAARPYTPVSSDPGAEYAEVYEFDASSIEPQIALPWSPDNVRPISQVDSVRIDQVFIGSCTNGRLEDLRMAARILRGRHVHPDVRAIVIPASRDIYLQALREGLIEVFTQAGCVVSASTCGPCLGGHMGVLGKGERCVSTSNRNFVGRMGHPESESYLANPAVAAASAVAGRVCHPEELGIRYEDVA